MHLFAAFKMDDDKLSKKQQIIRKLFHDDQQSLKRKHNINDARMELADHDYSKKFQGQTLEAADAGIFYDGQQTL